MRVAALYDVHGNVHALEAVLQDAGDVDVVLFGGDLAAGPLPRETVDLARSLPNAEFVLGNADVLASLTMSPEWDASRRWIEAQLEPEQIEWLATLPFSWTCDDVLYVHANPVDFQQVVTEWTPVDELRELLTTVETARVMSGHVHMQWEREMDGIRWFCAGSVGMPYEDSPGAYWALVEDGEVSLRHTPYDLEAAAAAIRAGGHPLAERIVSENLLQVPSRDEARAAFAGR